MKKGLKRMKWIITIKRKNIKWIIRAVRYGTVGGWINTVLRGRRGIPMDLIENQILAGFMAETFDNKKTGKKVMLLDDIETEDKEKRILTFEVVGTPKDIEKWTTFNPKNKKDKMSKGIVNLLLDFELIEYVK